MTYNATKTIQHLEYGTSWGIEKTFGSMIKYQQPSLPSPSGSIPDAILGAFKSEALKQVVELVEQGVYHMITGERVPRYK